MDAVRAERGLPELAVPPLCVLDFDGDLADFLAQEGLSAPVSSWACFHTSMRVATFDGLECGLIPRTIGGPYAVLIAEQLWAAGAQLIVGLSSAGRVSPTLLLPSIVVVNDAIRDEGTSLHYLPQTQSVATPTLDVLEPLVQELRKASAHVRTGRVWTTDAPYRETVEQLEHWASQDVLAVEMQAASLFAFARARQADVALVALVSNSVHPQSTAFDTGGHEFRLEVLTAIARAGRVFIDRAADARTR
jgi:uridine phosphorylase